MGFNSMTEINIEALHPTYLEIFNALDKDEAALLNIFKRMSGQQINLPVHLYTSDAVKKIIQDKAKHTNIDVNEEAERFDYSRRWIRSVIKDIK